MVWKGDTSIYIEYGSVTCLILEIQNKNPLIMIISPVKQYSRKQFANGVPLDPERDCSVILWYFWILDCLRDRDFLCYTAAETKAFNICVTVSVP